jgi:hypothetical protein
MPSLKVQSTVTDTPPPNTFFSSTALNSLENYYMVGTNDKGNIAAYTIYDNINVSGTNYKCVLPNGGNKYNQCTSEALAYLLNFYSELYMLTRKSKPTNYPAPFAPITMITYILNTITVLYNNGTNNNKTVDYFQKVMFPIWQYTYSNSTILPIQTSTTNGYYDGSATDSNIEILKSLLKLYIFNSTDKYLSNYSFSTLAPLTTTFLGIKINTTDKFDIVLKKIIVLMSYNLMVGDSSKNGNFSISGSNVNYWKSCANPFIDRTTGENLIGYFADYINFGCFIYLYKFFELVGMDPNHPERSSIHDIIQEDQVSTITFPSWTNTKTALNNYINYINNNLTATSFGSNLDDGGDNAYTTINRLSYQIINLLILLSKGDKRLGLTSTYTTIAWGDVVPLNIITNICKNFVDYEKYTGNLKLELITNSNITINSEHQVQHTYGADAVESGHPNDSLVGFFRQLSYMCVKKIVNSPSWPTKRSNDDSTHTYFENHDFEYFGLTGYSSPVKYSLQHILDTYDFKDIKYSNISKMGENLNYDWKNGGIAWEDSTDNYFQWILCSLHQMNYYLYLGY